MRKRGKKERAAVKAVRRERKETIAKVRKFEGSASAGLSVKVGDLIAPAGLYASDHDAFVFLVDPTARIEDGSGEGLSRGFFVETSEVGDGALKVTFFSLKHVCGNHIIWGAGALSQVRVVHLTGAGQKFDRGFEVEVTRYAALSSKHEEDAIAAAKKLRLGATKEEVLDLVFGKKKLLTKRQSERAYELAESHPEYGDPLTAWGFANGATLLSQESAFADVRTQIDRAAGKVLALAQ